MSTKIVEECPVCKSLADAWNKECPECGYPMGDDWQTVEFDALNCTIVRRLTSGCSRPRKVAELR